LELASTYRWL